MSKPSKPMSASKKRKAGPGPSVASGSTLDDLTALTTAQLYSLSSRRHRDESLGNVRRAQEERDRAYLSLVSSSAGSCSSRAFCDRATWTCPAYPRRLPGTCSRPPASSARSAFSRAVGARSSVVERSRSGSDALGHQSPPRSLCTHPDMFILQEQSQRWLERASEHLERMEENAKEAHKEYSDAKGLLTRVRLAVSSLSADTYPSRRAWLTVHCTCELNTEFFGSRYDGWQGRR